MRGFSKDPLGWQGPPANLSFLDHPFTIGRTNPTDELVGPVPPRPNAPMSDRGVAERAIRNPAWWTLLPILPAIGCLGVGLGVRLAPSMRDETLRPNGSSGPSRSLPLLLNR
jgi:hypothetical protein